MHAISILKKFTIFIFMLIVVPKLKSLLHYNGLDKFRSLNKRINLEYIKSFEAYECSPNVSKTIPFSWFSRLNCD